MQRLRSTIKSALVFSGHAATRFWREDDGVIVVTEMLLIGTILVLGLVAALAVVRAAIVTELADFAGSIGTMNQSFGFGGTSGADGAFTASSSFLDAADSGDVLGPNGQQAGGNAACLVVFTDGPATPG